MDNNFENKMAVNEVKGLLRGLEDDIRRVRVNLYFDTLDKLPAELTEMRLTIDRIEGKINYSQEDELY